MAPKSDFPPVRAAIFDMDGLLIDSEDAYTRVTNTILHENGKPDLPWEIKAQLQGRPGPASAKIFFAWAQLQITQEQFQTRAKELQALEFPKSQALPGVPDLLKILEGARTITDGRKVRMALATSSHRANFEIKTAKLKYLFQGFPSAQIVVGDDPRVPKGRGKPLPDIYLLALETINQQLRIEGSGEPTITPEECLVFEDSVPGVEAGRRAGMRVVWCPHPGLLGVYKDRVKEVLAARTGEHDEKSLDHQEGIPLAGSPGEVGKIDDGWAVLVDTLENFDYEKYGIDINGSLQNDSRTESGLLSSPGTTDKELEEMTARADGKLHAKEEGSHVASGAVSPIPGLTELNPKV